MQEHVWVNIVLVRCWRLSGRTSAFVPSTRATRPAREDIKTLEDKDDWSKGLYSRWEMEKLVVAPPLSPVRQGVATFRATESYLFQF